MSGPQRELTRHFLARLFDSELVSTPGEWMRVAVPAFATALSAAMLLQPMYQRKYALGKEEYREALNTPARLLAEVRFDEQSIAMFLMVITAVFAAIFWQSFYPSLRDSLALAALPVRPRQIFLAKLTAVTLLFTVYSVTLVVPSAALFTSITGHLISGPHFAATVAAWLGACAFVYFSALAFQGLLLNVLPPAWFNRASVWAQASLFGAALAAVPLFTLLPAAPAAWFAGLWGALVGRPESTAAPALLGLGLSTGLALAFYAAAYHRYRALILEVPASPERERGRWREAIIRRATADPREQAMLAFIVQSLFRSRTHQFVLLALAALAVSLNVRVVSGTADPARELQYTVVFGPLAMSVVALAGFRYLFALPTELRANWLFRITEGESRTAWLRAVEKFVLAGGVGASFLCWLPAAAWSLGIGALIAYAPALLFVLWLFERLYRDWRKAPFTCSYLPGKQPPWKILFIFFYTATALSAVAGIALAGVLYPPVFFLITPFMTVLWVRARARRLRAWQHRPLLFEEASEVDVEPLDLANASHREGSTAGPAPAPGLAELWWAGANEESVAARVWRWTCELPRDVRLALRGFRLRPAFMLGAVLTIALGLGLNAAFFAIYDAFYLRQAAVREPHTLYDYSELLRETTARGRPGSIESYLATPRLLPALRARRDVIVEAAGRYDLLVRHGDRILVGLAVTGNYFPMLGARPALGSLFGEGDDEPQVVLSHRAWRGRFGANPAVIGQHLEIRKVPYRIAGVAAAGFTGVATDREPDFWIPLATWPRIQSEREPDHLAILLRLHPRLTVEQAKRVLLAVAKEYRTDRPIWEIQLRSAATFADSLSDFTYLIFLTFAFTLAIPCANVANMMLARGLERQRELGVRLALGSSRGRLARQLLTESVLIALAGGALGFVVARAALDLALRTLHSSLPWLAHLRATRVPEMAVDARVFLYLLAVALVTAAAFALWPALESARWGAVYALRRELGGLRDFRLRDALVAGQVAVCVMMLASAALLLRGTMRLTRVNPGFDPVDLHAVATLDWHVSPYVDQALREQPWLSGVARASHMPTELREVLLRAPANGREFRVPFNNVSAEYHRVLGIPLAEGRGFLPQEAESKAAVAIVSQAAAQLLWPRESALGKVVRPDRDSVRGLAPRAGEFIVVGVTRERAEKEGVLGDAPRVYFPEALGRLALVRGRSGRAAETGGRLERLLSTVRSDTGLEVTIGMEDILELENYAARAGLWVAGVLAVVALVLTATGVYGVMAFLAGQRRREIGIRVALGATSGMVMGLIVRHAARLIGIGLIAGLILALWSAKLIAARTMYVAVWDATGYLAGLAVVGLVALAAAIPPAWRAAREDVLATLRLE